MSKKIFRIAVFVFISTWILTVTNTNAQKSQVLIHKDKDYLHGKELYVKEKYAAAMERFEDYLRKNEETSTLYGEQAQYLHALSAVELFQNDAQFLLYQFVKNHPESPLLNDALFALGNLAYRDKQYGNCLRWMMQVDHMDLDKEKQAEYFFRNGYSHFRRKEYEEARVAFYEILNTDNRYSAPASYYYSHIHYEQENYETALKGFLSLKDDETFSPITPYYVTQIYFMQKKWKKVIEYAPGLLKTVTPKRYGEMTRILGEAYFHEDMYPEAVIHLEKYHEETSYTQPEDKYMMGFAYYMTEDYEKAKKYFKSVSLGNTALAQSALYHMADCYVRLGDKYQARLSFSAASKMDYDKDIKEDASFNYAVVTYELSISPFNEAVRGFSRYISLYPASKRLDEAYNYMVLAFMGTRNYRGALAGLDRIQRKTPDIEKSYQRVSFFRGMELFNDLNFQEASNKFDASLKYGQYDPSLKALCYYWKGECQYRLKNYNVAKRYYQDFLGADGASRLREYAVCHYNIGYAEFKQGNYKEALTWFRRFETIGTERNRKVIGDSYNRIGDMYFIEGRYNQAIGNYEKAIDLGIMDVDYALFQKGISLGVLKKYTEKIEIMGRIPKEFPKSNYIPESLYESGRSYFILLQPDRAIPFYQKIIDEHLNSTYVSRSLVQLGLIHYNQGRLDQSISFYKKAVSQFPGTQEANNALQGIKTVYVEKNQVSEYFAYVESLGREIDISGNEQDSLSYLAAENLYLQGNCGKAIPAFESYVKTYESGAYLVNAHFYMAECQLKADNHIEAMMALEFVIDKPRNIFTEPALLTASRINFDYKNYRGALKNFLMMKDYGEVNRNLKEATIGIMRCYYQLEEFGDAIDASRAVLREEKISDEVIREANFIIAKSFYAQDRFALALDDFRKVATEVSSQEGAESKYRVAEIQFIRKDYENAEKTIFEFIDLNTPHDFWMAKSFILLADLYLVKEDDFQAVQTLTSIIDYYEETDDGILDLARRKKVEILKRQNVQDAPEEERLEVEMEK